MKKSTMLAGVLAIGLTGAAQAGEPVQLSSTQMDGVTAGAIFITSNAAANAIQAALAVGTSAGLTQNAATATTTNSSGASANASSAISVTAAQLITTQVALQTLAQFAFVQIP